MSLNQYMNIALMNSIILDSQTQEESKKRRVRTTLNTNDQLLIRVKADKDKVGKTIANFFQNISSYETWGYKDGQVQKKGLIFWGETFIKLNRDKKSTLVLIKIYNSRWYRNIDNDVLYKLLNKLENINPRTDEVMGKKVKN